MQFIEHKSKLNLNPPSLPIIHICELGDSESVLENDELSVSYCKSLDDTVLYFFYGKPSYITKDELSEDRTDMLYWPIALVFNVENVQIHHIFPFDSGAFIKKKFSSAFHRNMRLSDFEIENSIEALQHYVNVFFGSSENYMSGFVTLHSNEVENNLALSSLYNLLTPSGTAEYDERANTIEIVSKESMPVSQYIKLLILPDKFLYNPVVEEFIATNSINYKTYKTRSLVAPIRYNEKIFEIISEYINEES